MRRFSMIFSVIGFMVCVAPLHAHEIIYPETAIGTEAISAFGITIADPYRWLENDMRQDSKVRAWVDAQNAVTQNYLASLPERETIRTRLTELWDFEKFGLPIKKGGRYFFTHNSGLQSQAVLFVQEGLGGAPRELIDANGWAGDGATSLAEWAPSEDGTKLAYSIQDGGSDWRTVNVFDVATGQSLTDTLKWVKSSNFSWARDGSGFYYSRFPEPKPGAEHQALNTNQAVYFHRVGDPQSADRRIYASPASPAYGHFARVTADGRWLVITTAGGTDDRYEVNIVDLTQPNAKPRTLIKGLEHSWNLVSSEGFEFIFVTNLGAPRYRVVSIDAASDSPRITEIVGEASATLGGASIVGDTLILSYLEDAASVVRTFTLDGKPKGRIKLPGIGSASGFAGERGDSEAFYTYSSFDSPPIIYRLDAATGTSTLFKAPQLSFDVNDYQVSQRFYTSKDGTRVPMFIVHQRGHDLTKGAPTLLSGYGGFNISITPTFSAPGIAWLERGGVLAVANIRGGGEYGKSWHDGGRLLNKQNSFDDFIAAAEHLIRSGITTPDRLAIQGASNGGLLVAAVVNQRPDLFAVALPQVGVMDMLRYNLFTVGRYWADDYGDPVDEKHFRNLLSYSPYHNIVKRADKDYPAILVTTAENDDRVVPGHSFKYAAALQAADIGNKPRLIRTENRSGHGRGKPTAKQIEALADFWTFVSYHTGLTRH